MLRNVDYRYFDKARKVANISNYKKQHIGCVAVYVMDILDDELYIDHNIHKALFITHSFLFNNLVSNIKAV